MSFLILRDGKVIFDGDAHQLATSARRIYSRIYFVERFSSVVFFQSRRFLRLAFFSWPLLPGNAAGFSWTRSRNPPFMPRARPIADSPNLSRR